MEQETIAAIATPPGEGAISVIRISGPASFSIANEIFSRRVDSFPSHSAHYGKILSKNKETLDTVLLLLMRAPRSYTGEDSIEISCHGGSLITRRVLERIIEAGARLAKPGEFSLRAYLNGKIDLAQAEAVQQLISAKNELSLKSAEQLLEGALSEQILSFQKELTEVGAILEAWIDFPEEGLEFASIEEISEQLSTLLKKMEKLRDTFHQGKMLQQGISLCLLGSPNVGKSSLMNALLGKERAIVTDIAGTTRDLLEEDLKLGALHFRLVDTAGIRDTTEIVEKEGIRRSQKAMQEADLILLLLDTTRPLSFQDHHLLKTTPQEKTILVWNKIDQHSPETSIPWKTSVCISAREKIGLDSLQKAIETMIWKEGPPSKEELILTHQRHHSALCSAVKTLGQVIDGLQKNLSPELVTSDLRHTLHLLSQIIGTNVSEDILSAIFSKFCLGK